MKSVHGLMALGIAVGALLMQDETAAAGTATGVAVDLRGRTLAGITVTVSGGGSTVTDANGAFTVTTPDVRPINLTFSGAGSQTVNLSNLDGSGTQTLRVVVPEAPPEQPCPPKRCWFGIFCCR